MLQRSTSCRRRPRPHAANRKCRCVDFPRNGILLSVGQDVSISRGKDAGNGMGHPMHAETACCRPAKRIDGAKFTVKRQTNPKAKLAVWSFCTLLLCSGSAVSAVASTHSQSEQAVASDDSRSRRGQLKSIQEFRDEGLVRQRYDYSCGAAALATLLQFVFEQDVTEQQIIDDLLGEMSQDDSAIRQADGFSLFDLQRVARKRGYKAEGYRLDPRYLARLNGPVIVFLETMGYKHFAVLKGVRGDRVYLADPSRGNIRMPAYRFLQAWMHEGSGTVFVVEPLDNAMSARNVLLPNAQEVTQPELVGVRELLAVGTPFQRAIR